jgi:hypothetical protein
MYASHFRCPFEDSSCIRGGSIYDLLRWFSPTLPSKTGDRSGEPGYFPLVSFQRKDNSSVWSWTNWVKETPAEWPPLME